MALQIVPEGGARQDIAPLRGELHLGLRIVVQPLGQRVLYHELEVNQLLQKLALSLLGLRHGAAGLTLLAVGIEGLFRDGFAIYRGDDFLIGSRGADCRGASRGLGSFGLYGLVAGGKQEGAAEDTEQGQSTRCWHK